MIRPTLDVVLKDPESATSLPRDTLVALLLETAAVQSTLAAALVSAPAASSGNGATAPAADDDQMLTVDEAAKLLRRSRRWFYRRAKSLPFIRRTSARSLLVSRAGLQKWLERQR